MKFSTQMLRRLLGLVQFVAVSIAICSSAVAQPLNNSSGHLYVVREGETLRKIAQRFYEDELAFPTIIEGTNRLSKDGDGLLSIENEFDIRAGQKVWVPLQVTVRLETSGDTHTSVASATWTYQGKTNPSVWASLQPDYRLCASGTRQSPVIILPSTPPAAQVPAFDYHTSNLIISNNGRHIQISHDPGSSVKFDNVRYELAQLHFHVPSEHRIGQVQSSMEAHFVHLSQDRQLLVIAVLYDTGAEYIDTMAEIWNTLPPKGFVLHTNHQINVKRLFNFNAPMFHYVGSLTTPPCTEGVKWFVVSQKEQITRRQLSRLVELTGLNARPTQQVKNVFDVSD